MYRSPEHKLEVAPHTNATSVKSTDQPILFQPFVTFALFADQFRIVIILQREVGHVIRAGREGRKGSDMPIRLLVALDGTACRRPWFRARKTPKRHRFSRLFAPFAPGVDQLRVVILSIQGRGAAASMDNNRENATRFQCKGWRVKHDATRIKEEAA